MNLRTWRLIILSMAILLVSLEVPAGRKAGLPDNFGMTGPQFWRFQFGTGQWINASADSDGDGRADLIAVGTSGSNVIEIARTSPQGKPLPGLNAWPSIGAGVVAAVSGKFFSGETSASVLAILADGSIKVAWGMGQGANTYSSLADSGLISSSSVPEAPSRSVVCDFDGDSKPDVLILDRNGRILLLKNNCGNGSNPKFTPITIPSNLRGVRQLAAGMLGEESRGRVVWLDDAGKVWSTTVTVNPQGTSDLGAPKIITNGSPDDHLAVGRFRGGKNSDILIGQQLLVGGNPADTVKMYDIPAKAVTVKDGVWEVADIDGNGKDDLIRHSEDNSRIGGGDVYVHFSYDTSEAAKGYLCSSNDGLLDIWKSGKIKPGGLDLVALGCKVGRRDIIIEIERFDNEPEPFLRANMDRVVRFFASLPVINPDGSTGIAVHLIYKRPYPLSQRDYVGAHFDELFPPIEHRGIVHSALTVSGGPLVSQICGDHGKTNEGWAEFLHEFGHQIDLRHDGFYPSWSPGYGFEVGCALYPSLMSYSYSYVVDGSHEKIGYSDGSFASFKINERSLSERLPFSINKVNFLSNTPYRFKIKGVSDGKSTLVDWNWNGLFDEKEVVADVNYSHGVDFGPLYAVGQSDIAPVLVVHGEGSNSTPFMFYGREGRLISRSWLGRNRDTDGQNWSDEVSVLASGISGDPTAAFNNGVTWVAYPTDRGAVIRPVSIGNLGRPSIGAAILLPGTVGTQPTVTSLDGQVALLLWRSKTAPVGLCLIRTKGTEVILGAELSLDITSDVPVGATAGKISAAGASLWVGRIESDGKENGGRTEVVRFEIGPGGSSKAAYRSWLGGHYARRRMTLLWRPESGLLPEGRIYQFSGSIDLPGADQNLWITMNTPYSDMDGGWLFRRYQQPGLKSPSTPGACFFGDDIIYMLRRSGNNELGVAFYGSGAAKAPLGDFNDVKHICDYGLSRSIRGLLK